MATPRETTKDLALKIIGEQPDDSTLEELARELLFHQMILEGLADSEAGRVISHEQMKREAESWFKSSGRRKRGAASARSTITSLPKTRKRRSA